MPGMGFDSTNAEGGRSEKKLACWVRGVRIRPPSMALKKSELYSSLWASCDELRGGMDASQYKDYVLVLPFVKYVSDKYAGQDYAPITIPPGTSFANMVALKGKTDIGDQINKKILGPLAQDIRGNLAASIGRNDGIHGVWLLIPTNDQDPHPFLTTKPSP